MKSGSSTPPFDRRTTSTTHLRSPHSRYWGLPIMESRRSTTYSARRSIEVIDLEPGDSDHSSPAIPTPILPVQTRQGRGSGLATTPYLTPIPWSNPSQAIPSKNPRMTAVNSRQVARRGNHHRGDEGYSSGVDSDFGSSSTRSTEEVFDHFNVQSAREGRRKRKSPDDIDDDGQYGIQWATPQSRRHIQMLARGVQDDWLQDTGGPSTVAKLAVRSSSSNTSQPNEVPSSSRVSGALTSKTGSWRSRLQSSNSPKFLRTTSHFPPPAVRHWMDSLVIHVNPESEPNITVLSLGTITTHLNSGLVQPYCTENLRRLAGWWTEGVVEAYGVKQKWLLASTVWKWWGDLLGEVKWNPAVKEGIKDIIEEIERAKKTKHESAKRIALAAHPGLIIEGQVYDLQ